jgi:hypothetical protein
MSAKAVCFLFEKRHGIYKSMPRHFWENNRNQSYFSTLEDQVGADNPVRLMDAFINKLEMAESTTIIQPYSVLKNNLCRTVYKHITPLI